MFSFSSSCNSSTCSSSDGGGGDVSSSCGGSLDDDDHDTVVAVLNSMHSVCENLVIALKLISLGKRLYGNISTEIHLLAMHK